MVFLQQSRMYGRGHAVEGKEINSGRDCHKRGEHQLHCHFWEGYKAEKVISVCIHKPLSTASSAIFSQLLNYLNLSGSY